MDLSLIALGVYRILLCLQAGALLSSLPGLLAAASPTGSNVALSFPVGAAILLMPLLGYYSDRMGQRKFILLCEAASVLLFLGLLYLPLQNGAILLLPLYSTLIRIMHPLTLAGIVKSTKKGFTLGLLKSLGDLALLIGAVIGVALSTLGPAPLFTLLGSISLGLIPFSFVVPDARSKHEQGF